MKHSLGCQGRRVETERTSERRIEHSLTHTPEVLKYPAGSHRQWFLSAAALRALRGQGDLSVSAAPGLRRPPARSQAVNHSRRSEPRLRRQRASARQRAGDGRRRHQRPRPETAASARLPGPRATRALGRDSPPACRPECGRAAGLVPQTPLPSRHCSPRATHRRSLARSRAGGSASLLHRAWRRGPGPARPVRRSSAGRARSEPGYSSGARPLLVRALPRAEGGVASHGPPRVSRRGDCGDGDERLGAAGQRPEEGRRS